jgi:hypothetical protein
MADYRKAFMPERLHQGYLVRGHGALGVGFMLWITGWLRGIAIAAQISGDNREMMSDLRYRIHPCRVSLWVAV